MEQFKSRTLTQRIEGFHSPTGSIIFQPNAWVGYYMSVMFSTSDYFNFNWNTPSGCSQADQEKEKVELWFENLN